MRDFAWVRVSLRILGVFLSATSVPGVMWVISSSAALLFDRNAMMGASWYVALAHAVSSVVPLAIGIYLCFGGRLVYRMCIRGLDNCCPNCGYTFKGLTGKACPECGTERPIENNPKPPQSLAAERSN